MDWFLHNFLDYNVADTQQQCQIWENSKCTIFSLKIAPTNYVKQGYHLCQVYDTQETSRRYFFVCYKSYLIWHPFDIIDLLLWLCLTLLLFGLFEKANIVYVMWLLFLQGNFLYFLTRLLTL